MFDKSTSTEHRLVYRTTHSCRPSPETTGDTVMFVEKSISTENGIEPLNYVVFAQDGVFVARCLDVDVASDGPTEQESVANLREALELYFDGYSNSPFKGKAPELCRQIDASGEPEIVTAQD